MDPTPEPRPGMLLTPGEWPGVRATYRFAAIPEPSLVVRLEFRPERLADDAATPASLTVAAEAALARIGPMLLEDPAMRFVLTTSLHPVDAGAGDGEAMRAALAAFAEAIALALEAIRESGSIEGVAALTCTLTAPASPTWLAAAGDDVSPVTVDLTLSRAPGPVDPIVGGETPARETRTESIAPDLEQGLPAFAEAFEATWRGYDGGEGRARLLVRDDAGATPGALWAMRWSPTAGMHVSFGDPAACFTLGPLSTRLLDGAATISTYDADFEPASFTSALTGVDLDLWADTFFRALDQVLSPATAAALERVAPDAAASLAADRARLAKSVARGLVAIAPPSPEPPRGDAEEAATCFALRLIERPAAAYGLCVIQLPAAVTATTPAELRLSGDVAGVGGSGALARRGPGAAWHLTFAALPAAGATELRLAPRWSARTLERGGERLRFVLPGPALELPAVGMPVPARSIPGVPALHRQAASQSAADPPPDGLPRWDYALEISVAALVARDDLWLRLEYNLPIEDDAVPSPAASAAVPDALAPLFEALASFHGAWSTLEPALRDLAAAETGDARAARLARAVAERVSAVTGAWEAVERGGAMPEPPPPTHGGDTFVLRFRSLAEGTVEVLCRADETGPGRLVWPVLNGAAPSAGPMAAADPPGPGEWLAATYPLTSAASGPIEITLPALDPLARQTARASCWQVRNAAFPAPAFVHRTAVAEFASPVIPALTAAPMGPFAPAGTLAATLQPILEQTAAMGAATGMRRMLDGSVRYRYPLPGTAGAGMALMAEIPVMRLGPVDLEAGDAERIAGELAADIDTWRVAIQPDTPPDAELAFEYAVWAESAQPDGRSTASAVPLLRLPDVRYAVPPGWWMPE
jgi:hypothetical protein